MNFSPYFIPYTTINSKCITDLKLQLLKKYRNEYSYRELGSNFLDIIPKALTIKEKISKLNFAFQKAKSRK